jgi:hypothetical protein
MDVNETPFKTKPLKAGAQGNILYKVSSNRIMQHLSYRRGYEQVTGIFVTSV